MTLVRFQRLSKTATIPTAKSKGAAGLDLYADESVILYREELTLVPTGIAIEFPNTCVGLLCVRSSLASKKILLANGVGVIDSDYRGEIKVALFNASGSTYRIEKGDRIAQLIISPLVNFEVELAPELTYTERGAGGFGSTGVK